MRTAVGPRHDQQLPERTAARIAWGLLVLLIIGGWMLPPARGADMGKLLEDNPDEPWHIAADTITYDNATRRYVADGNVRISRGGGSADGRRVCGSTTAPWMLRPTAMWCWSAARMS